MSDMPIASKTFTSQVERAGTREVHQDILAGEAPLHIRLNGESYVTTMRTPDGFDEALARGLLFTEGIVTDPEAALSFAVVNDPDTKSLALLDVQVDPSFIREPVIGRRNQLSTSSCGICGTRDQSSIEIYGDPIHLSIANGMTAHAIEGMMASMRHAQVTFQQTGGSHGAGAYSADGEELVVHEDIGRHNAVDKVIGSLLERKCLQDTIVLTVSGRVSYEIVTKAYRAAIPILVAVSAASSMAVETAEAFGITLIGFCREGRMTIYSHPERISQKLADE